MKYAGIYKVSKDAKRTEDGFVFEDIEKRLAEATNPADKHMLEQSVRSLLMIDEDASLKHIMEIPEGTPAEELEKAKSRGMTVTDDGKYIVTKAEEGKFENEVCFLSDSNRKIDLFCQFVNYLLLFFERNSKRGEIVFGSPVLFFQRSQ